MFTISQNRCSRSPEYALGHKLEKQPKEYDPEFHSTGYEHLDPANNYSVRIWLHTQTSAMAGYKTLEEIENEEKNA